MISGSSALLKPVCNCLTHILTFFFPLYNDLQDSVVVMTYLYGIWCTVSNFLYLGGECRFFSSSLWAKKSFPNIHTKDILDANMTFPSAWISSAGLSLSLCVRGRIQLVYCLILVSFLSSDFLLLTVYCWLNFLKQKFLFSVSLSVYLYLIVKYCKLNQFFHVMMVWIHVLVLWLSWACLYVYLASWDVLLCNNYSLLLLTFSDCSCVVFIFRTGTFYLC